MLHIKLLLHVTHEQSEIETLMNEVVVYVTFCLIKIDHDSILPGPNAK